MIRSKKKVKQILRLFGLNFKQFKQLQNRNKTSKFSSLDEEKIIGDLLEKISVKHRFFVDIGAANGVSWSNSCLLAMQEWHGLSVEYNIEDFAELAEEYRCFDNINLSRCMVTPDNVISLFKANQVPTEFGFLNLDIDSYDYFVLEQILKEYRPSLICTEINHIIPPPIKFTVNWHPEYCWSNNDACHGQSISQLNVLVEEYEYGIVNLEFNNAFLVPKGISNLPFLSPKEAFEQGFLNRKDRQEKFPWGKNMEEIYALSDTEALKLINQAFQQHQDKYTCSL